MLDTESKASFRPILNPAARLLTPVGERDGCVTGAFLSLGSTRGEF